MLASPENTSGLSAIRNKRPLVIVVGLGALLLTACSSSNEESLPQQSAVASASSSPNSVPSTSNEPTPSSTIQNDPISDVLRNYDPDSKFPYSYAEAKETLQTSGIGDFSAITNAIDAQDLAYFTKQKLSVKQLETNLDMYS